MTCRDKTLSVFLLATAITSAASPAVFGAADNFEAFAGTSGNNVSTYTTSPAGTWTDVTTTPSTSNVPEVVSDATEPAYDGSYYLRLVDTSGSVATGAQLALSAGNIVPANGATISFALRDEKNSYDSAQVVVKAGSYNLLQFGLQYNGATSARFSATSYGGSGNTGAANVTFSTTPPTPTNNDWYLVTIGYAITGTTGTYSVTVIDNNTGTQAFAVQGVAGNSNLANGTSSNISSLVVQSSGTYTGNSDLDAISISTPEPASATMIGCMVGSFVLRRRRAASEV